MAKTKKKAEGRQFFPREPDWSLAAKVKAMSRQELLEILDGVVKDLKTESMLHQLGSLVIGLTEDSWLFALDMGAGKTKIALDIFTVRSALGECQQMLVLAPPVTLSHWGRQVQRHSRLSVRLVKGSPSEKVNALRYAQEDVVVVSHDWFARVLGSEMSREQEESWLRDLDRFGMVSVDESHGFKSHSSKRFGAFARFLADSGRFVYLFTGTPIGNNYLGVWAQYFMLDGGETFGVKFGAFARRWFSKYLVKGRFPVYKLLKASKEEFFDLFWTRAVRWEEAELQDLPEKMYEIIPVAMDAKQAAVYDRLLEAEEGGEEQLEAEMMRVTGGVHPEASGVSSKLEALAYLIEELVVESREKCIVWHWLVPEGRLIAAMLRERFKSVRFGEVRGETSGGKEKILEAWRAGELDVLVANQRSLGIGVDLYEARIEVFYSNTPSLIDRVQSEKRIHRTGQKRTCYYFDLVCEDTIDEYALRKLSKARDAFAGLTRDQVRKELLALRRGGR